MKQVKLSAKLTGAFAVVAVITLIVGFIGWRGISQINEALTEVTDNHLPCVVGLATINDALANIDRHERVVVYETNPELVKRELAELAEAWQEAEKGRKAFESLSQSEDEAKLWKEFLTKWDGWKKLHEEVVGLIKKGDEASRKTAYELSIGKSGEAYRKSEELIHELIKSNMEGVEEFEASSRAQSKLAISLSLAGMLIGTIFSFSFGVFLSHTITKPIRQVIEGLSEATEQLAAASGQVASASQHLAEGASEQAASIEETSSSLEEMTSMTRQNAENSGEANQLMAEANRIVRQAGESMSRLTVSMGEISRASEETQKIIKTIDEIAFQTNLLALNAAVEAARAGEAGAGFAVVADEVRNLALRAAEAARNTAGMIESTVSKIREGAELVESTERDFSEVARSVTKSGELMAEISVASREQAQGIDQVNQAVSQMDKVTQQNAASAEQSASASEEMSAQALQMGEFVSQLAALVGGATRRDGEGETRGRSEGKIRRDRERTVLLHVSASTPRRTTVQGAPSSRRLPPLIGE